MVVPGSMKSDFLLVIKSILLFVQGLQPSPILPCQSVAHHPVLLKPPILHCILWVTLQTNCHHITLKQILNFGFFGLLLLSSPPTIC